MTVEDWAGLLPNWPEWHDLLWVAGVVGAIKHGRLWVTAWAGTPDRRDTKRAAKLADRQRRTCIRYCLHLAVDDATHRRQSDPPDGLVCFFLAPATHSDANTCHICQATNAQFLAAQRVKTYDIKRVDPSRP